VVARKSIRIMISGKEEQMPFEMPEAIVISGQINDILSNSTHKVSSVEYMNTDSLERQGFTNKTSSESEKILKGHKLTKAYSKGKWIFIETDDGHYLLSTMETAGKILYFRDGSKPAGKWSVGIGFENGSKLYYTIVGWGFFKIVDEQELTTHAYPGKLGLNPLDKKEFTLEALSALLDAHKKTIKEFFTGQRGVAGIGNGYLQDVLFLSGIHPKRKTSLLTKEEKTALFKACKSVMEEAIAKHGRLAESDLFDKPGNYVPILNKETLGAPCQNCGTPIEKAAIAGSASYFCPKCQKI